MKTYLLLSAFILSGFTSCKKEPEALSSRTFSMATTPWPADFTTVAVDNAYSFINQHCDMVSHHFDEGIPYQEALNQLEWPQQLKNDVAVRKQKTSPGKKVLLSVAALNLTRHEKADYYREADGISDSIKNYWKLLPFNDNMVITAYVNYVSFLIDALQPQFINYGVESNEQQWNSIQFNVYKDFLSKVYFQLKARYPSLPFFISFMVTDDPKSLSLASQLLTCTDMIGLSAYPYISSNAMSAGNTDPENLSASFFDNFINLAPQKPWGFAETGYIAQNLSIPNFSIARSGTSQWQADYLEKILKLCRDKKAKFVVWFCSTDYDAGNMRLQQMGLYQDLFGLWQDTGFTDENNQLRMSYQVWLKWMQQPLLQ